MGNQLPLFTGIERRSVFSACQKYRYFLPREWDKHRGTLLFIGANPSKAGQVDPATGKERSDPTVSRMVNTAEWLGYGSLWVVNARSWIATDPKNVPADPEAIGAETDAWIERAAALSDLVVCAYGHLAGTRAPRVLEIVRSVGKVPHVLALTADRTPRHPRGVPKTAIPFPLEAS